MLKQLLALLLLAICEGLDCKVTLPRLLLGDQYSNPKSNETALIIFETKDNC